MFLFASPAYLAFMLPGLALAVVASILTKTRFARYSRVAARSGVTGAQAAQMLLEASGIGRSVRIEPTRGFLSDHYDPTSRTLRLSPAVYQSPSLAAVGVACHEAGHAIQHAEKYAPLGLRTALVPVAQIGSNLSYPILLVGMFMGWHPVLINLGCILLGAAVLFTLVTLPVEWDASARAKKLMVRAGIVTPAEMGGAAKVLNAAFLTYVASTVTAILQLLYFLSRARR